jgi:hypothetical protein
MFQWIFIHSSARAFNDGGEQFERFGPPPGGIDLRKEKKLYEKNLRNHESLKNAG